jgi:hypothetical protein
MHSHAWGNSRAEPFARYFAAGISGGKVKRLLTKLFSALAGAPVSRNENRSARGWAPLRVAALAVAAGIFASLPATTLRAQQHKSKVPLLGKLASPNQEAYTGTVQSLNIKENILSVNSRQGRDTEIFPLKKDVRVEAVDGKRMQIENLTPGTSVLIYFHQKRGERTVKNIIVLDSGKKSGPSQHSPAT